MESYRIYRVGRDGRLQLGEAFRATDDAQAIAHAQTLHLEGEAELWQGGRLLGRISQLGASTPRLRG